MASRDKVDADSYHKGIQYSLEKLGKSKFRFERTVVSNFKSKRHVGSGNEIVLVRRAARVPRRRVTLQIQKRSWLIDSDIYNYLYKIYRKLN